MGMDQEVRMEELEDWLDSEIASVFRYHGELGCVGPDHGMALSVDIHDHAVLADLEHPIRLSVQPDEDPMDVIYVDFSFGEARSLALHLLNAAAITEMAHERKQNDN